MLNLLRLKLMDSLFKFQWCWLMVFWLLPTGIYAQEYRLTWVASPEDQQLIGKQTEVFADSLALQKFVKDKLHHFQASGYLQSKVVPTWQTGHLIVQAQLGRQFEWIYLRAEGIDPRLLQQAGYRNRYFENVPFKYSQVASLMQKLIHISNHSGYPFAEVGLDSVQITDHKVSASLLYNPGPYIQFEGLDLQGPLKIKKLFLEHYLKVIPHAPYQEEPINQIAPRLSRLPYLKLVNTPVLTFQNDQATVHLELEPRKANRLDGIIGFLPNAKADGSLLLTGQFDLLLQNMFGGGRRIGISWESFKPQSQKLNVDFKQPLILRSPINVAAAFNLLKEDSTFLNTQIDLRMAYEFSARGSLELFTRINSTRLSSEANLNQVNSLGDLADFDVNNYGLAYHWVHLNEPFNPTTGTRISLEVAAGNKKIRRNSGISDSLYQNLEFQTPQLSWSVEVDRYWSLWPRLVLYAGARLGGINNRRLFFNDLYRLGGLKSLRGFNENSFFAEEYFYTTLEPRFYIDNTSYLFAFYDQAWWLSYELAEQTFSDSPSGLGAGINLRTDLGNFRLVWALGRSESQALGLAQSKMHFGYVTTF